MHHERPTRRCGFDVAGRTGRVIVLISKFGVFQGLGCPRLSPKVYMSGRIMIQDTYIRGIDLHLEIGFFRSYLDPPMPSWRMGPGTKKTSGKSFLEKYNTLWLKDVW